MKKTDCGVMLALGAAAALFLGLYLDGYCPRRECGGCGARLRADEAIRVGADPCAMGSRWLCVRCAVDIVEEPEASGAEAE